MWPRGDLRLRLHNRSERPLEATVRDPSYGRGERRVAVPPGETQEVLWDLQPSHHWYDLTISVDQHRWRLAGHVEDGHESVTDPAKLRAGVDLGVTRAGTGYDGFKCPHLPSRPAARPGQSGT
jgi:Bacterial phospholipase C, C-terminal domain